MGPILRRRSSGPLWWELMLTTCSPMLSLRDLGLLFFHPLVLTLRSLLTWACKSQTCGETPLYISRALSVCGVLLGPCSSSLGGLARPAHSACSAQCTSWFCVASPRPYSPETALHVGAHLISFPSLKSLSLLPVVWASTYVAVCLVF